MGAAPDRSAARRARPGVAGQGVGPGQGVLALQVGIGSGNTSCTLLRRSRPVAAARGDDALPARRTATSRDRPCSGANDPARRSHRISRAGWRGVRPRRTDRRRRHPAERARESRRRAVYARPRPRRHRDRRRHRLPHAFYPERPGATTWSSGLRSWPSPARCCTTGAATWPRAGHSGPASTSRRGRRDTLNLYDTSALAHADLAAALRRRTAAPTRQNAPDWDLRAQLERGASARLRPVRAGRSTTTSTPHRTRSAGRHAELYAARRATPLRRLRRGAAGLGARRQPVGRVTHDRRREDFPHCPQHVVANLSGHQDGTPPVLVGAVVNGPNPAGLFADGIDDFFSNGHACPAGGGDALKPFNGHGSRFVDNVSAWQTVEPAIDFDAVAALASRSRRQADACGRGGGGAGRGGMSEREWGRDLSGVCSGVLGRLGSRDLER